MMNERVTLTDIEHNRNVDPNWVIYPILELWINNVVWKTKYIDASYMVIRKE